MTKKEAIQAAKNGSKITHPMLPDGDYIIYKKGAHGNGVFCDKASVVNLNAWLDAMKGINWDKGWSIVEELSLSSDAVPYDLMRTLTPDQIVDWLGEARNWIWENVSSQPGDNYQLQVDELNDQELINLLNEHYTGGCNAFIKREILDDTVQQPVSEVELTMSPEVQNMMNIIDNAREAGMKMLLMDEKSETLPDTDGLEELLKGITQDDWVIRQFPRTPYGMALCWSNDSGSNVFCRLEFTSDTPIEKVKANAEAFALLPQYLQELLQLRKENVRLNDVVQIKSEDIVYLQKCFKKSESECNELRTALQNIIKWTKVKNGKAEWKSSEEKIKELTQLLNR